MIQDLPEDPRARHEVRVEDRDELAARRLHPGLQRSRLVARPVLARDVDDVEPERAVSLDHPRGDLARLVRRVVEDLDLEQVLRIVERRRGVDQPLDDVDFVVDRKLHGDAREDRKRSRRAGNVQPMPVVETNHQDPVRPVEGQHPENQVVDDDRRDLRGFSGHGTGSAPRPSTRWALFAGGEAIALGFLGVPDARAHLAAYLSLLLAGSVLAFVAARSLSASRASFVVFCAAVFRLTLLFRPPDLSEDVWRYLWDGRVARAGISPWAYAPDDPAVAKIAPLVRGRVAHRDIRTVYPPRRRRSSGSRRPATAPGCSRRSSSRRGPGGRGDARRARAFPGVVRGRPVRLSSASGDGDRRGQGHVDSVGVALLLVAAVLHRCGRRRVLAGLALALSS